MSERGWSHEDATSAGDGRTLVHEAGVALGLPLHVLTHEEEALLTVVGVMLGFPPAIAFVAGMGFVLTSTRRWPPILRAVTQSAKQMRLLSAKCLMRRARVRFSPVRHSTKCMKPQKR